MKRFSEGQEKCSPLPIQSQPLVLTDLGNWRKGPEVLVSLQSESE